MYRIEGLEPKMFERLFEMDDAELARIAARRVIADGPGFPCRVSLVDAAAGETVVLCHHAHHDVASPYRADGEMAHAEVVPGAELAPLIERWFADPIVAYLHAHNARPGCFAARIDRS